MEEVRIVTEFCTRFTHADHVPDPVYGGAEGVEYVSNLEDACAGLEPEIIGTSLGCSWCIAVYIDSRQR